MMWNIEAYDHYLNRNIPPEIVENLKAFFPEEDLSYEEVLLQQEGVYQSIQANERNGGRTADCGNSHDWSQFSRQEGECSWGEGAESQLALDEALARSLQELEEDYDDFHISEHGGTAAGNTEISPIETPVEAISQDTRQDGIDPDNMTYEQLQSLDDNVENENKGLSEEVISRLPTFKYKTGMFSKNRNKKEECVICCMIYKSGDWLTTLPCAHQYHSDCSTHWLKLKKVCPVCQKEVQNEQ